MTKKYEFESLSEDELVSAIDVIRQSVRLMDLASKIAAESGDVDKMAKISLKMLSIGATLAEIVEEDKEEEEEVIKPKKNGYGFAQIAPQSKELEVEDEDDE